METDHTALAPFLNVKPIAILRNGDLKIAERAPTPNSSIVRVMEIAREEF